MLQCDRSDQFCVTRLCLVPLCWRPLCDCISDVALQQVATRLHSRCLATWRIGITVHAWASGHPLQSLDIEYAQQLCDFFTLQTDSNSFAN